MFCTNCGKQLGDGARFCAGCGAAVALAGSVAAPVPSADAKPKQGEEPEVKMPMRTEAEFRAFYERTLLPELVQIDQDRKVVCKRILVVWGAAIFIVVLAFAVGQTLEGW